MSSYNHNINYNNLVLEDFEYFTKIKSLLNNRKLNALLKKYNIEFCYGVLKNS